MIIASIVLLVLVVLVGIRRYMIDAGDYNNNDFDDEKN
jgi:uncharacterized ion transporter superfamily protein YfcC